MRKPQLPGPLADHTVKLCSSDLPAAPLCMMSMNDIIVDTVTACCAAWDRARLDSRPPPAFLSSPSLGSAFDSLSLRSWRARFVDTSASRVRAMLRSEADAIVTKATAR